METYQIKRLGLMGDGIADGPVYAPLTLPDETVTGDLDGQRLKNIRIQTPSDHRVKAPCSHFKSCGGCQLMHAHDDFVAQWKADVVETALKSHGIETEIRPTLTSPIQSRRRATFSVRRTKKDVSVGFHGRASQTIVDIPNCILIDPRLKDARDVLADLARVGGSRKGELSCTVTLSDAGLDIVVKGGKPLDKQLTLTLAQRVQEWKLARLTWEDEVIAMREAPYQRFGSTLVLPPPGSFLQATQDGEDSLRNAVQSIVGSAKKVLDLFAGCGTFSLGLAEGAEVHAVEGLKDMTKALDEGWRRGQGLKKVTHEARDLFRRPLMPDELAPFDAIVIDPPRAGAEAQIAEIAKVKPPVIAYVSCNPVTFARDVAYLTQSGYVLEYVQPVDQFRWSTHVELVAKLAKK